jgi:hypothetical protein
MGGNNDEVNNQTDLFAEGVGELLGSKDEIGWKYQADF